MEIFEGRVGERLHKVLVLVGWMLVLFLVVEAVGVVKGWQYIGTGTPAANTINVSGHGEMFAVPDIATFSFSVVSDKATVADAQAAATAKINALTDYLTGAGVEKKDIQTSDYSVNPQYDYQNSVCPTSAPSSSSSAGSAPSVAVYCPPGRQVLRGYEVRQTTTIKVRDTKKAGDLLAGVGSKGATEVSGLQFTFDDLDAVQTQARDKAIADAKDKAQALAHALGVHIVRVVSFNESSGGGYPRPMMYDAGLQSAKTSAAPEISVGQNKVTNDVSITYEIR